MINHNPNQPDQLEQLAKRLDQWRLSRPNRRTPTPEAIRSEAIALIGQYTKSKIIQALKINNNMLKSWRECNAVSGDAPKPEDFVELPSHTSSLAPDTLLLQFSVCSAGHQVTLQGHFTDQQLTVLARGFISSSVSEVSL